jgi:flagellar biosynthetic protein FliR
MIDFGVAVENFDAILLVLIRMSGLFILSPVFGRQNMPALFKVGFAFFLTLIYITATENLAVDYQESMVLYVIYVIKELAIGIVMGYVTYIVMSGIYLAGQIIDNQIGFGYANVLDPITNIQVPLTSNFYYTYIILIFLLINGHHMIIRALFYSYKVIPLGQLTFSSDVIQELGSLMAEMFGIALRISAPIIAAVFIADVVLGVLSKTIPEMNVFVLGMPIKVMLGLIIITITISNAVPIAEGLTTLMEENIVKFFTAMNGA